MFFTILYNRKELGVLSLIGGFAVPFMVSDGEGNYQVLFSYLIILNIGMIILSFYKNWSIIKILSFIFTQIIFVAWLIKINNIENPPFYGAIIFAFCFYLIFISMNLIYKLKVKSGYSTQEIILILSNNFIFYICGMYIFDQIHSEYKGIFTLLIAIVNFIMAKLLMNQNKTDKNTIYVLIGSVLTFITLIAPVQLDGNYITIFWAIEALLLVWIYQKSKLKGFLNASIIIHFLMIISLMIDWIKLDNNMFDLLPIIINKIFITGLLSAISLFGSYFILKNNDDFIFKTSIKKYTKLLMIIFGILIYLIGFIETSYQSDKFYWESESIESIIFCYHLIMISILLSLFYKFKNDKIIKTGVVFSYFTLFLYLVNFIFNAIHAFEYQIPKYTEKISWGLNYVNLILVGLILFILNKIKENNQTNLLFPKIWITRIFMFLVVYILSNQALFHGIIFKQSKIINWETYDFYLTQNYKILLPITWGILSFLFLYIGIKKSWKTMRITTLFLLLITLLKLFIYDIQDVSEAGKIIAFILLGVLILIMSFMYQKIKKVLINK